MLWSKVLNFTDPFPYQKALRISDVELFPTAKGEFRAELMQINLSKLWMQRGHENLPHVVVGTVRPVRKAITFLTKEREMVYCGQEVLPGSIIVQRTDTQHRRNGADRKWGSMSLTHNDFDAACKAITGCEYPEATLKLIVRPSPDLVSRLLKAHETVGKMAQTMPDLLAMPEVLRALEQQLIHLMIRCLTENVSSEVTAGNRRHDLIVARFEEFMEANPDQPLYLMEICTAIGVSERTLRVACEKHLGMGPIRYLALRRMHLVRRALLRADPSRTNVTRIATDHGFWELGRFSVNYRELFGESPSESLRRSSEERPIILSRPSSLESPAFQS
ncbi:helix-turn-helix domain-containing protein [Bradyrhizobium sp. SSUT112]|uniref:helix-turn-helix domain-containing protein n=1 Tax=Bradyrhizobium sp. SSUT112 TaxID=3040604 RepID=UPI00244B4CCF|nr:helix-turn-helix domain-containing protein [Bradyrhizobium sp. SSUT112]MDH2351199.1 helix-turn-helix domain-containing protein [Bradyrhizobium sp. SSUT112]